VVIINPARLAPLLMLFQSPFPYTVIMSSAVAADTMIVLDAKAFAYGLGAYPKIRTSIDATLHYEESAPQPISTVGSPNVSAAPVRSTYQVASVALRLILDAAWVMRGSQIAFTYRRQLWATSSTATAISR
jgi:hypothetical protein